MTVLFEPECFVPGQGQESLICPQRGWHGKDGDFQALAVPEKS